MNTTYTYDKARDAASKLERDVSRVGSDIADTVSQSAERAQAEAQVQLDKLSTSIRKNPLQSAAIAAGVGFLFAVLARR